MEVVDILRHDQQVAPPLGVEPCQRDVRRIGHHLVQPGAPLVVEAVDEFRVASQRLRRAHVLDAMPLPETVRPAKGRQAAFGGNARAGQDDDVVDVAHARAIDAR